MDDVDIDNEDLNELESRLYAQIHHEATDESNTHNIIEFSRTEPLIGINNQNGASNNNCRTPNANKILSGRYWASSDTAIKQRQENKRAQHCKQNFIRNPFKTPQQHRNSSNNRGQKQNELLYSASSHNQTEQTKEINNLLISNEQMELAHTNNNSNSGKNIFVVPTPASSLYNKNKMVKSAKIDHCRAKSKLSSGEISNLKLNPVADWMKRKRTQLDRNDNRKSNAANLKNSSINLKQGLFARQEQKLLKAKRIEEKRQKSKRAKKLSAKIANKIKPSEVIVLESENESDSSDIMIVPTAPIPTYTLEDSAEEDGKDEAPNAMEHDENAIDSTDVQMSSTTARFMEPQQISIQTSTPSDGGEKRLELSRCTSPCSMQSSDDFIGQNDRSRLLVGVSGMADDEDLMVLTSDMSSVISKTVDEVICVGNQTNLMNSSVEEAQSEEFSALKMSETQSRPKDYRVDQGQFRAVDVYESESDITDSVYSKGAAKPTVIRQIDTSSDETEEIYGIGHRPKRLQKRRGSSTNKETGPNEHCAHSSDSDEDNVDEEEENSDLRTAIPFIVKGPAVESYRPRKRRRTVSSCSNLHKQKSRNRRSKTDRTSDKDFINTLNNLVQGQEGEQENHDSHEADESEVENVPTAREIAEKVLAQHSETEKNKLESINVAVPEEILKELDEVFQTIDKLDRQNTHLLVSSSDTDSSENDKEKHLIYKTSPNEDGQIIKYCPDVSETPKSSAKTYAANGSPIYTVVYYRGSRKPGGIGWNDEMRKFYNESWNGEHFMLRKILQKLNPDKRLWKIYTEDRFNVRLSKRSNIKCMNCYEFGHLRSKCKKPKKPMICYMCGNSGHYEPRCPNTICLRCGNKTQVFTKSCNACHYQNNLMCLICNIRGHSLDYCPDKWRRYHSTTEINGYPNNKIYYNPRKYCCICGASGHISDNCRSSIRFMEYPAIASTVKSHQKSYNDVVARPPYVGIALNLMYEPCEEYEFDLVEHTSSDKYYGRFLKAVGMDYLFQQKRHRNTVTMEIADIASKNTKRLSKQNGTHSDITKRKNKELKHIAPNQVQEITESGNIDQEGKKKDTQELIINIEDQSDNEVEMLSSCCTVEEKDTENFKSPENITTVSSKKQTDLPQAVDSDSNYSFSEHFDVTSSLVNVPASTGTLNGTQNEKECAVTTSSRPGPRKMGVLPDFIPLTDSNGLQNTERSYNENRNIGISKRFLAVESDQDDEQNKNRNNLSPPPELPCEAKIYLTHFHSKYLLSPPGNAFLVATSRAHMLKARLDLTSVGHVLVIFGLPSNQDKFQRDLLLKYRELEDEKNQKQLQRSINVPKRTYVLIKFLRENISQLMNNLGNVNHLLKRLQYLERQQTKSGYKLAEKVRRSLNMILVGQAGLQDGTMHLDKLLVSLKKLLNDVRDDIAPPELRSEISNHWKVIFSAYRHENYEKLVNTYNKLISKNRLPQLNIDPILLGQKVLNTNFSEEQKQKLQQACTAAIANKTDANAKPLKRKHNINTSNISSSSIANTSNTNITKTDRSSPINQKNVSQTETTLGRISNNNFSSNDRTKSISTNAFTTFKSNKSAANTPTSSAKIKVSSSTIPSGEAATTIDVNKTMFSPPFANPEMRSTTSATIQEVADKWKTAYDTLLTEITSEKPISKCSNDAKLPSTFWSRESMRYLNGCIRLVAGKPEIIEKLQRVQNKSNNGQLSYNDYLAVIKLHTALNGK